MVHFVCLVLPTSKMTWPVSKCLCEHRCSLAESDIPEARDPKELLLVYIVYHRSRNICKNAAHAGGV